MQRTITGYREDDEGSLVAVLECGHGFHQRHRPPFELRPWTLTAEGRASMLGTTCECLRCDRFERPDGWSEYKRSPEFTAASTPAGLLADHALKDGVWGELRVDEGRVTLSAEDGALGPWEIVAPATHGIAPRWRHRVSPSEDARFQVVFFRCGS